MSSQYPAWINHSGLPKLLGSAAWLLFKAIVELDCRMSTPMTIDVSFDELAAITGLEPEDILDTLPVYREHKLAKLYIPDDLDTNPMIELYKVLPTPETHAQVREKMIPDPAISIHRYCDCPEAKEMDPRDPAMREICDLYLATINCTMNALTVDRLKNLRYKATMDDIRRAFWSAQKNEIRSFNYVERTALKLQDKRIKNR